jgi:membrane fusion protein (multidrug efflux system)
MKKRMIVMLVGVGVLLGGIIGFNLFKQAMMKKYMAANTQPPATVTAMPAALQAWQPQLTSLGTLRAVRGIDVTSEVAGIVRRVDFRSGEYVKAGQILVELDTEAERAQLQSLRAAADLAEAQVKRDKLQAEAQAVSQAQLDSDAADLKSKLALVDQQLAAIAKKEIRASFAGRLGISTINVGQYLNPGDKIVSLQATEQVYVDFYLPQRDLAQVALGRPVSVSADAFPERKFVGRITSISATVDNDTRNFEIEAMVANPKHELRGGMYANVAVDTGTPQQQLTLPQTAVTYNPYGATVFVAKDSGHKDAQGKPVLEAQQVFVSTGSTRGDQVAVVKGIEPGALVVTSGQLKLKNGTPLAINNSVQPADNPDPTPQE